MAEVEKTAAAGGYPALWDWRRRVSDLYGAVRAEPDPQRAWALWRDTRDALFRDHAQSPLEPAARSRFAGLPLFDYDPALRFAVDIEPLEAPAVAAEAGRDGALSLVPFGLTRGLAQALGAELTLYWVAGYGGGAFLPFADATAGRDTYGGGRYLLDTIKGADLGCDASAGSGGRTVLDFNFSYNPSCSYSPAWVCPLSPPANRLRVEVRAGERTLEVK